MSAATKGAMERAASAYRAGLTLLLAAACYEAVARSGVFPAALLPTLPKIASTLWALLLDGTMLEHAGFTMYRVLFGLAIAIAVALPRLHDRNTWLLVGSILAVVALADVSGMSKAEVERI